MKTHHAHRGSNGRMDAIELLKQGHRDVAELFSYFDAAEADDRRFIAEMICRALTTHAQIEDEIFDPVVRDALGAEAADLLDQAKVEHESLATLIEEIRSSSLGGELFAARVKVLKDYVKHHVRQEEHGLFPKVKCSGLDLHALGAALELGKPAHHAELVLTKRPWSMRLIEPGVHVAPKGDLGR
jgi:iron-sulfur cluster repair protein YtfE (RIC family)